MSGAEEHSGRPASRACRPDSEHYEADNTKSVTNSILSLRELTVRESLRDATEHEGEVLRSRTDEDLNERGIGLHKAGVHGHPRKSHDSFYERHVRAVKARDDVHEGLKPLMKLRDRRGLIKGRFLSVELVNEHVIWLFIPLRVTKSTQA